jgi:hypothetical protein
MYDRYVFDSETPECLDVQNFQTPKEWSDRLFWARQNVTPLKEYQGTTARISSDRLFALNAYNKAREEQKKANKIFRILGKGKFEKLTEWDFFGEHPDTENELHIEKLTPAATGTEERFMTLVTVCTPKTHNTRSEESPFNHPQRFLETFSHRNENAEVPTRYFVVAMVSIGSQDHAKLLARFDDPAFRRVFGGLVVVPKNASEKDYDEAIRSVYG